VCVWARESVRDPVPKQDAARGDAQDGGTVHPMAGHGMDCRLSATSGGSGRTVEVADVRRVGVVGCGLMGSGIVEVVARAGASVTFVEGSQGLADSGRSTIERSVRKGVQRGKLDAADAEALLGRIEGAVDLEALSDVDLVIEAATEQLDAKLGIFARLGEVTRDAVVLSSNTSSIPIVELAVASGRPTHVVGLHFFNPPPVMQLLELTPAITTSEETLAFVRAYGTDVLGKTCVQARDEAGFIVNRLLIPYLNDAIRLYEQGFATREDIDAAVHLGLAHPMGPLTLTDLVGLDTTLAIGEVLFEEFRDPRYAPPSLLRRLVAAGHLGRKSGRGFYVYD
jgi:3-hydroxybutyryl-CoA dehydrogenase